MKEKELLKGRRQYLDRKVKTTNSNNKKKVIEIYSKSVFIL
jgi:hypothetical protein